jgi:IS5 family transposase
MEARGVLPAIIYKRNKGQKKLYPWQRKFNKLVSQVRAIGEHPYAWMRRLMSFARCRYRGLRRNAFDFTMTAAAYNVCKAVSLLAARAGGAVARPT